MMNFPDLTLPSPAKLNLFLLINGRCADGYHDLQTYFQLIDLADEISFTLREDQQINLTTESEFANVPVNNNIIIRAAQMLQQMVADETGEQLGCDIHLKKRIPIGAGLGGGSSNAATTLIALTHLWQLDYDEDQLADLAEQLGADVPIFIYGYSAWAQGIGEDLFPMSISERHYLVVFPGCLVSTAEIFAHPELTRDSSPLTITEFPGGVPRASGEQRHCVNDCQALVTKLYPEVAQALEWLAPFGNARLTGTGSAVFVDFADAVQAQQALAQLPSGVQAYVCKGLNFSPVHGIVCA